MAAGTTAAGLTTLLAAAGPDTLTDADTLRAYVHSLLDAGLPLLPLRTDSGYQKAPAVPGGFNAATVDTRTWDDWIADRAGRTPVGQPLLGIGMRVGTRVIVADIDNPEERTAFDAFRSHLGITDEVPDTPTVTTPGTTAADGNPVHHGGGHWWFHSPLGTVPRGLHGTVRVDAAGRVDEAAEGPTFALMLTTAFVVIPPTTRDDGPYRLTGVVHDVPDALSTWMRETADAVTGAADAAARAKAARRLRPRTEREAALDSAIEDWEDRTSWADLLTPLGWTVSGHDTCGCEQWLRPGSTSTKSVTAHECSRGTYLQVWTDNAGNVGLHKGDSLSKMQTSAAVAHGGDVRAALTAAGVDTGLAKVSSRAFDLRERVRAIVAERAAAGSGVMVTADYADPTQAEYDMTKYPEGHPNDPTEMIEPIFNFNNTTRAIYHAARARPVYTPVMSMLFSELFHAGRTSTERTHTELDDQLSTYLALCSRSGGSKSVTLNMLLKPPLFQRSTGFQGNLDENAPAGDMVVSGLASGQAMIDGLSDVVDDPADDSKNPAKILMMREPAVLTIVEDELDNLAAKSQQGSTLSNTVLSAWSCGPIGDLSRTHGNRQINGAEHPYSVFLAGGIQPARSASMVGRTAVNSGLAQRVFFLATEDPWFYNGELGEEGAPTRQAQVAQPDLGPAAGDDPVGWDPVTHRYTLPDVPVGVTVGFCDEMRHAMAVQHTARGDLDPAATHLVRMRIRIACLMALHSGATEVSSAVWDWAGMVMEHRRRTFAFVRRGADIAAQEETDDLETGREIARLNAREAVATDCQAVAAALQAKITAEGVTQGKLRASVTPRRRRYFADALSVLESEGVIVRDDLPGGGTLVRLKQ
jgi:hypothetical protein